MGQGATASQLEAKGGLPRPSPASTQLISNALLLCRSPSRSLLPAAARHSAETVVGQLIQPLARSLMVNAASLAVVTLQEAWVSRWGIGGRNGGAMLGCCRLG